jgi:hypothetical protein
VRIDSSKTMEQTKRHLDHIVQDFHGNKKQKLNNTNKSVIKKLILSFNPHFLIAFRSVLENLPNEIIYKIFQYLNIYHIYDRFSDLNKRFNNLYKNSNLPIQLDISTMRKTNFERYYTNIILPNRHRINYLRLSNPFTTDIVFSPSSMIEQFLQLETLVLDSINQKSFDKISTHLIFLPKLHSLIMNFAEHIKCPNTLFDNIFNLDKLKYCKITYQRILRFDYSIHFTKYNRSSIEHLVINTDFLIKSVNDLLLCLPKLRHLSINYLGDVHSLDMEMEMEEEPPVILKHLKSVSLKIHLIRFNQLATLIKKFFRHLEVFRLTTKRCESEYLNAKQWEQLISSYLPNLRIFDINHDHDITDDQLSFHDLINQFNSSFWIEKQWFFIHQHAWLGNLDNGEFYSTNSYRYNSTPTCFYIISILEEKIIHFIGN